MEKRNVNDLIKVMVQMDTDKGGISVPCNWNAEAGIIEPGDPLGIKIHAVTTIQLEDVQCRKETGNGCEANYKCSCDRPKDHEGPCAGNSHRSWLADEEDEPRESSTPCCKLIGFPDKDFLAYKCTRLAGHSGSCQGNPKVTISIAPGSLKGIDNLEEKVKIRLTSESMDGFESLRVSVDASEIAPGYGVKLYKPLNGLLCAKKFRIDDEKKDKNVN